MDLANLFAVNVSPFELVLRGTCIYWFLLLVFRFVLRRDPGTLGVADLLFIVIVADASQNAMSGGYDSVAEGLILIGTLMVWNVVLDWGSYRWKALRRLTEPEPLLLVDRGRIVARNMRKEYLTRDDLDSQLREAGVTDLRQVRKAYMEGDGKFSVLRFDEAPSRPKADSRGTPGAG
jgi:uncharacterized membrane protein YcaP (DUF421 family)